MSLEFTFPSIQEPNTRRYVISTASNSNANLFKDVCLYLHSSIYTYETMGDGETQHTPRYHASADMLIDLCRSLAAAITGGISFDDIATIRSALYSHYHATDTRKHVKFLQSLQYEPDSYEKQYYSIQDTDKNGKPRKSKSATKAHDKRWHEIHRYNGAGTVDAVLRCLSESEAIPSFWLLLDRLTAAKAVKLEFNELGIWEDHNEFEQCRVTPNDSGHSDHMMALSAYCEAMRVVDQMIKARHWVNCLARQDEQRAKQREECAA